MAGRGVSGVNLGFLLVGLAGAAFGAFGFFLGNGEPDNSGNSTHLRAAADENEPTASSPRPAAARPVYGPIASSSHSSSSAPRMPNPRGIASNPTDRGSGVIAGMLYDPDGRGVRDAHVTALRSDLSLPIPIPQGHNLDRYVEEVAGYVETLARETRAVSTDSRGQFSFRDLDSTLSYTIVATADGLGALSRTMVGPDGPSLEMRFGDRSPVLSGRVRTKDGKAPESFTVAAQGYDRTGQQYIGHVSKSFNSGDGRFQLDLPQSGNWHLSVTAAGFFQEQPVTVEVSGRDAEAELTLGEGAILTGIVRDLDGTELASATITLMDPNSDAAIKELQKLLEESGELHGFWGTEEGRRKKNIYERAMKDGTKLDGRDLDPQAEEDVHWFSAVENTNSTDEDGRASPPPAEIRTYQLKSAKELSKALKSERSAAEQARKADESTEKAALERASAARAKSAANASRLAPGYTGDKSAYMNGGAIASAVTNSAGRYRIESAKPGSYNAIITYGGKTESVSITIVEGANTQDFAIDAGGRIVLTLSDSRGKPINPASVTAQRKDNQQYAAIVPVGAPEGGRAVYAGLEPGDYTITIAANGYATITREISLIRGANAVNYAITEAVYLKGSVTMPGGEPLEGIAAYVLVEEPGAVTADRTDGSINWKNGHYATVTNGAWQLGPLEEGTWVISLMINSSSAAGGYKRASHSTLFAGAGENKLDMILDGLCFATARLTGPGGANVAGYITLTNPADSSVVAHVYSSGGDVESGSSEGSRHWPRGRNRAIVEPGEYLARGYSSDGQNASPPQRVYLNAGENEIVLMLKAMERCVRVTMVSPDSQAVSIGLQEGDKIFQYNGQNVTTLQELSTIVRATSDTQSVTMLADRDGSVMSFTLKGGLIGINGTDDFR